MAASYDYAGNPLTHVRRGSVELTQQAEHGASGGGQVIVNDKAGTKEIVGWQDFGADEDACSNPITFRGFVKSRQYAKAGEPASPSRDIQIELEDRNAVLSFRLIHKQGSMTAAEAGKRPAETVAERGAWLLASPFVSGLFGDNGRCDFSAEKGMDKADYRNSQHPGDVLADMALAQGGVNHYIRDFGDGDELVFRDDNASTDDTSDVRISNVIADVTGDVDGLTFYPYKDFSLTRSPERVISKLAYSGAKNTVIEQRPETATDFNGEHSGTASNSNVKEEAKLRDEAQAQLWQLHTEEDVLEGSVIVPRDKVNLLNHGDRMQAKFSHLATEGYGDFSWFRVLSMTKRPLLKPAAMYEWRLRLSPQEAAEPAPPDAVIVQSVFGRGTSTGLRLSLPNPVTIGNVLVVAISTKLDEDPDSPNITVDLPHIGGTGAWTRFNGATLTRAVNGGGISVYYKTATDTDRECYVSELSPAVGIWELAGADPASATIQDETLTTDGPTYTIGSAGTVATGEVALFVCAVNDGPAGVNEFNWVYGSPYAWQTANPNPGIAAGWNLRYSKWVGDNYSAGVYLPGSPWTVMADAIGDGSSLDASITPGESGHYWYGLYIVIPPV